ncbi:MAG: hypothetical protein HY362_00095 [Candidatus Aenigmarchaeota archaeon]|nr:hypothetical protein [Candidatus Aenigmarchaeota archaeon]
MAVAQILHYPNLKTVLMVEEVLKRADTALTKQEIKERLPKAVMHQTLNVTLEYLEEKGMVAFTSKGIVWIYNPSSKMKTALENAVEV